MQSQDLCFFTSRTFSRKCSSHLKKKKKNTICSTQIQHRYTAAHAPLEPLQQDLEQCDHFTHSRRRHFCGLMVGLDRNVDRLAKESERILGRNTLFIFSSDNGGATFFGGLNDEFMAYLENKVKYDVAAVTLHFSEKDDGHDDSSDGKKTTTTTTSQ